MQHTDKRDKSWNIPCSILVSYDCPYYVQKARETSTNVPRYCRVGYCTVPCARSSYYTCSFLSSYWKRLKKVKLDNKSPIRCFGVKHRRISLHVVCTGRQWQMTQKNRNGSGQKIGKNRNSHPKIEKNRKLPLSFILLKGHCHGQSAALRSILYYNNCLVPLIVLKMLLHNYEDKWNLAGRANHKNLLAIFSRHSLRTWKNWLIFSSFNLFPFSSPVTTDDSTTFSAVI